MNAATSQLSPKRLDPRKRLADDFADHPLVAGHLFYSLPVNLLLQLRAPRLALHQRSPDLYRLERVMTYLVAKQAGSVGAWNRHAVIFRLLSPPPPVSSLKGLILRAFKDDPEWQPILSRLDRSLPVIDATLDGFHEGTLGYCGWLLVNPQFIREHDQFFAQWRNQIRAYGLPRRGPLPEGIEKWFDSLDTPDTETLAYARDYGELLDRWELADLQAPYLPEPREIQFPVLLPHQANHLARSGGQLMYLPANVPVPDRDTARELMAGASGARAAPAHLREWRQIVHATNTAKNRIGRFARLFRLQHYWGVLHKRWGPRLKGCNEKLHFAFAAWLLPDEVEPERGFDTIRKDLRFIAKHRGRPNWYRQPNALDLF